MSFLIGLDSGTSSVKVTVLDCQTGKSIASAFSPTSEMDIISHQSGWAEQKPHWWWENACKACKTAVAKAKIDTGDIEAIGITYQMHGLVAVDKKLSEVRPAIIWCDSRAVEIGNEASKTIGEKYCLENFLNSPGNFTASKLKWIKDNEPKIYSKIHKIMLPGDYLAMMMTGEIKTTISGLSEGIMWNFKKKSIASEVLDYYGISEDLLPDVADTFAVHGELSKKAAAELGLKAGIKVAYRAGDQPNNAFSLNVLNPGEVAATAGTSGVVYGVADNVKYDMQSRVNSFAHINYTTSNPRYGALLCINGTGILNSWLKHNIGENMNYGNMDELAASAPVGCVGLSILPYGNGAERSLANKNTGASMWGLNFNVHDKSHILRAAQEGIVFALKYGIEIMNNMGVKCQTVRAGKANMFRSSLFCDAFATVTGSVLELYDTDGSEGAARGAGIASGIYKNEKNAFEGLEKLEKIEPDDSSYENYIKAYELWKQRLEKITT